MTLIEGKDKNNATWSANNNKSKSNKKCDKISCTSDNIKSNNQKPSLNPRASKDKRKNNSKSKDKKKWNC